MRKKQEAKHANKKIWKRRLLAGLIACGIFVTTGCGQVIDLTDEENHLIAEYAAELLLKYDRNYDTRYNPDELEDTTETMTETDATTEATTEVVSTTEAATTEQDAPADGQTTQAQPVTDEAVKEDIGATVDSDFDIAAFVGESRISVRYAYYMVVDSYPSYDQDGMYIEVQAPEGYKLLVLKFEVENKTNEEQAVDPYNKDVPLCETKVHDNLIISNQGYSISFNTGFSSGLEFANNTFILTNGGVEHLHGDETKEMAIYKGNRFWSETAGQKGERQPRVPQDATANYEAVGYNLPVSVDILRLKEIITDMIPLKK